MMVTFSANATCTMACSEMSLPDSIAPAAAPAVYPYLNEITGIHDIDSLLMMQRFKAVRTQSQTLMNKAKRRKQPTGSYEKALDACAVGERGLRGVDRLVILDTIVVNKHDFLSAYTLSDEMGTLRLSCNGERTYYHTQLNGIVIGADREESDTAHTCMQLMRYYESNKRLTDQQTISGLGIDNADLNYPFLMPDGQIFYFAARSDEGYGNYDLYVTRYDSEGKRFYQAENMGYPYNSPANDYMLVINESANIGWFASDRYQPEGYVCIYTFVPNESRRTIDYETADPSVLHAFATLSSTKSLPYTPEEMKAKEEGLKRLSSLRHKAGTAAHHDFLFILNDEKDCYSLNDFSSAQARQLCQQWVQKKRNLDNLTEQLQQLRDVSPKATQQILNLERRVAELNQEVHDLEKAVRKAELSK